MIEYFMITIPNSEIECNLIKRIINKRLDVEEKNVNRLSSETDQKINQILWIDNQRKCLNKISSNDANIELNKDEILYLLEDFEDNIYYCPYEKDARSLGLESNQSFEQQDVLDKIKDFENDHPYRYKNPFIREHLLFREFYLTKDMHKKEEIIKEIREKHKVGLFFFKTINDFKEDEKIRIIYIEVSSKLIKIIKDQLIKKKKDKDKIEFNNIIDDSMKRIVILEKRIKGINCSEIKKELETLDAIINNISKNSTSDKTSKKDSIEDCLFMQNCKVNCPNVYNLINKLFKNGIAEYTDKCINIKLQKAIIKRLLQDNSFSNWKSAEEYLLSKGKSCKNIGKQSPSTNEKKYNAILDSIEK